VRTHRWKLYADGRLFDRENDPQEKTPVSKETQSDEAARARRELQAVVDELRPES
jgi:hypothetical protein